MSEDRDRSKFDLLRYAVWTDLALAEHLVTEDPTLLHAKNGIGETVLHYAAVENGINEVSWLIARGSDINTRSDFGETPLMEAATLDHYKMCKMLLENGADPLPLDQVNESALSHAAMNIVSKTSDTATLELILEFLKGHDINQFFDDLQLELLYGNAHPDVIKVLSACGLRAFDPTDDSE